MKSIYRKYLHDFVWNISLILVKLWSERIDQQFQTIWTVNGCVHSLNVKISAKPLHINGFRFIISI